MSLPSFERTTIAVLFGMAAGAPTVFAAQESSAPLPGQMPKIGEVDQRYQAYNLDLMAITGMPKKPAKAASEEAEVAKGKERLNTVMSGVKLDEPLDLQNRRLRILATGLGPAYLRTSGTSANSVYFQNDDAPALETPPAGYDSVLTRAQAPPQRCP